MWVVVCGSIIFGPFIDPDVAQAFAGFVTEEVDPAQVVRLNNPTTELLSWRNATRRDDGVSAVLLAQQPPTEGTATP